MFPETAHCRNRSTCELVLHQWQQDSWGRVKGGGGGMEVERVGFEAEGVKLEAEGVELEAEGVELERG